MNIKLQNAADVLELDCQNLGLLSFQRKGCATEWLAPSPDSPVFTIGIADSQKRYAHLTSRDARSVAVSREEGAESAKFTDVGGLGIDVTCRVRADADGFRFGMTVNNRGGTRIVDAQYPFVVCAVCGEDASLVLPHGYGSGRLVKNPLHKMEADSPAVWEMTSRNGDCAHYPGMHFAQFMACYDSGCGLYLACDDAAGRVKRFRALRNGEGMRLGVAHIGDWTGERTLEYAVLLRSFTGDWYDAADLYRGWSMAQPWYQPVATRKDVPQWLKDSPVHIVVRPAGVLDIGNSDLVEDFHPHPKCLALLDKVSAETQSPLAIILMGWENKGSWVYPNCFPPSSGEEYMRGLVAGIRARGWRAGCFASGTRWVYEHTCTGFDGKALFVEQQGEKGVCREMDGSLWKENWDQGWRPSYAACMAAEDTQRLAAEYVARVSEWGMESLQFFDQNLGSSVFPCFSETHGHPPVPGLWMQEAFKKMLEKLNAVSKKANPNLETIFSAESGLNECSLPLFGLTELRTFPPGYDAENIPLYQYLYHECVILQGAMGKAPEPRHLAMRNAVNCVLGGIPGGVLAGGGRLLDKDTENWALWEPYLENPGDYYRMIRNVSALRRGAGRDFLVFGRMLRPAEVSGIDKVSWESNGRRHEYDAVFHSAWRAPNGQTGVVLANWTDAPRTVRVRDSRLAQNLCSVFADGQQDAPPACCGAGETLATLPPFSCALLR